MHTLILVFILGGSAAQDPQHSLEFEVAQFYVPWVCQMILPDLQIYWDSNWGHLPGTWQCRPPA